MTIDGYLDSASTAIRVVIADDHATIRHLLKRVLEKLCSCPLEFVGEAVDGFEAVEIVERLQPDVVIMDVSMPSLDGIEATRDIRRRLGPVAIFGWTTCDDEFTRREMLAAGADRVFAKNGAFEELAEAICRVRDQRDSRSCGGAVEA